MISISKNVYINKLDDIVNKYSNTCNSKIKIKSVGVKSSTYINFDKKNNKYNSKFKVGGHVQTSKYKNIFAKGYVRSWSKSEKHCAVDIFYWQS